MSNPKHLHILSIGTSLASNYQRTHGDEPGFDATDQGALANFLAENPCAASAEINSLNARTGFLDAESVANDLSITLVHSEMELGTNVGGVLARFLKGNKVGGFQTRPFRGFDRPANDDYPPEEAVAHARQTLVDLRQKLTEHIQKMKVNFETVQINCTGGFKAESAILYQVGLQLDVPVYYLHESFRCCVDLPPA